MSENIMYSIFSSTSYIINIISKRKIMYFNYYFFPLYFNWVFNYLYLTEHLHLSPSQTQIQKENVVAYGIMRCCISLWSTNLSLRSWCFILNVYRNCKLSDFQCHKSFCSVSNATFVWTETIYSTLIIL